MDIRTLCVMLETLLSDSLPQHICNYETCLMLGEEEEKILKAGNCQSKFVIV